MIDFIIHFFNKHFNKNVTYEYNDFCECNFYSSDYEEV